MHGQTSKGFTLIELMVVIAVIAILVAVATPSYLALMDNYRLRQASEDVISLVSNSRSGAVKLHREVSVSFAGTGANWCAGANAAAEPLGGLLVGAATACDCTNPGSCLLGTERLAIPSGKHPGVSATASNPLVFSGVNGVTANLTGGTVTLTSPLNKFTGTVTVTPLGQANLVIVEN